MHKAKRGPNITPMQSDEGRPNAAINHVNLSYYTMFCVWKKMTAHFYTRHFICWPECRGMCVGGTGKRISLRQKQTQNPSLLSMHTHNRLWTHARRRTGVDSNTYADTVMPTFCLACATLNKHCVSTERETDAEVCGKVPLTYTRHIYKDQPPKGRYSS